MVAMSRKALFFSAFLAVIALVAVSSCDGGAVSGRLGEIESYIEKRPADALESLKSIDASTLVRRADKAKYALLMAMALDKTYVDTDDFSVLQPAIDYYDKNGSPTDKMRTAYYEGRIYSNRGEMTSAMRSWLRAVDVGDKSEDVLTKARTYFAMGNVYSRLFQWDKYVDTYIKAAELFEAGGVERSYHHSILRVASGYSALGKADEAKEWLDKATALYDSMSDSNKSTYFSTYLTWLTTFRQTDEIPAVLSDYLRSGLDIDWLSVANGYVHLRDFKAAKAAIDREADYEGNEGRTIRYWTIKSQIYEGLGDPEAALDAYRQYITYNDAYSHAVHSYDMQFMEQKYGLESRILKSDKAKWVALAIALSAVVLGLLVALLLSRRIAAQKIERDNYKLLLNQAELEKERLEKALMMQPDEASKALIDERLGVLNQLLLADIMKDSQMEVEASTKLREFYDDKEGFMNSTRMVFSASHPGFVSYLVDNGLDENDINYCCLYALGMNGKDVINFLGKGGTYNVASRIRKKLGIDSSTTNLDKYIRKLMQEKR
jgi:tetratricopeptide (TPR) repeat protein